MTIRSMTALALVMTLIGLLAGCGGSRGAEKDGGGLGINSNLKRARFGNLNNDGMDVTPKDINQDGKPDQWDVSSQGQLVRVDRDLNFDGAVDSYSYVNGAGELLEEEMDLDLDGKIDVVAYYRNGVLSRKELSVDFTGNISIIKYYDGGKLSRVERDTDNNNRIDVWEYYQDDVKIRTGRDISGDGTPDVFEEANAE